MEADAHEMRQLGICFAYPLSALGFVWHARQHELSTKQLAALSQ